MKEYIVLLFKIEVNTIQKKFPVELFQHDKKMK